FFGSLLPATPSGQRSRRGAIDDAPLRAQQLLTFFARGVEIVEIALRARTLLQALAEHARREPRFRERVSQQVGRRPEERRLLDVLGDRGDVRRRVGQRAEVVARDRGNHSDTKDGEGVALAHVDLRRRRRRGEGDVLLGSHFSLGRRPGRRGDRLLRGRCDDLHLVLARPPHGCGHALLREADGRLLARGGHLARRPRAPRRAVDLRRHYNRCTNVLPLDGRRRRRVLPEVRRVEERLGRRRPVERLVGRRRRRGRQAAAREDHCFMIELRCCLRVFYKPCGASCCV
ncbi:unnamed protein product, partial [Pelagomonas calceolata]